MVGSDFADQALIEVDEAAEEKKRKEKAEKERIAANQERNTLSKEAWEDIQSITPQIAEKQSAVESSRALLQECLDAQAKEKKFIEDAEKERIEIRQRLDEDKKTSVSAIFRSLTGGWSKDFDRDALLLKQIKEATLRMEDQSQREYALRLDFTQRDVELEDLQRQLHRSEKTRADAYVMPESL